VAGILCERLDDRIVVGIGVNVRQRKWSEELRGRATSIAQETGGDPAVVQARNAVLRELGRWYLLWRARGFGAVYPKLAAIDCLRGRTVSVRQTDDDAEPLTGTCGGIRPDGSLDVGGVRVYAGEAHVERFSVGRDPARRAETTAQGRCEDEVGA